MSDGVIICLAICATAIIVAIIGNKKKQGAGYMDFQQLNNALFSGCPVEHNGIVYKCVSAIIKRNKGGKPVYTAELTDKNNNSVSIVEPAKIKEVVL